MNLKFNAGDRTVHRAVEEDDQVLPVHDLFVGLIPDLAEDRQWLRDSGAIDTTDTLYRSLNQLPVRTLRKSSHLDIFRSWGSNAPTHVAG